MKFVRLLTRRVTQTQRKTLALLNNYQEGSCCKEKGNGTTPPIGSSDEDSNDGEGGDDRYPCFEGDT